MPPTYLRFSRRLHLFGDLFSGHGSPAHLRWIAGVLKLVQNANRIGAIFNSFISNMDRIVLLERQFSLALVPCDEIYKKKEEVGEDENLKKVLGAVKASRVNKSRPVSYLICSQSCDILTRDTFLCHLESQELLEKLSCYVIHSVADFT